MGTEDALKQAYDIGFAKGNVAAFVATADGMDMASNIMMSSLRSYYGARTMGKTSVASFYDDSDEE